MIFIDKIKENITSKLDEIGVFRENREGNILCIEESASGLKKVIIYHLPNENIWIFENEFDQLQSIEDELVGEQEKTFKTRVKEQKAAFESRGQKPEKTIFYLKNDYL